MRAQPLPLPPAVAQFLATAAADYLDPYLDEAHGLHGGDHRRCPPPTQLFTHSLRAAWAERRARDPALAAALPAEASPNINPNLNLTLNPNPNPNPIPNPNPNPIRNPSPKPTANSNPRCAAPIRAAMGADAALTTFEQGAGTVEDERPCSPCSASVVQAALRLNPIRYPSPSPKP